MSWTLDEWAQAGVLSPLDLSFAKALNRLANCDDPLALLGTAMACRAPALGHVCAKLEALAETVRLEPEPGQAPPELPWPELKSWLKALQESGLCSQGELWPVRPLVLRGSDLYLERFWRYEESLAAAMEARLRGSPELDEPLLKDGLNRLFPPGDDPYQRLASAMALMRRFTVSSGGPGTGKTTTVVRILALLMEQDQALGRCSKVALTAQTGKAAARLAEAVREQKERGELKICPELRAALPEEASTLHRLLGYQPRSPSQFRHNAKNPLTLDLLVVDEASMIDLPLMSKLFQALPPNARVILLGDRDQLASVETGAVFGDLYPNSAQRAGLSPDFAHRIRALTGPLPKGIEERSRAEGIWDATLHLRRSHRFSSDSGIKALSEAIRAQDDELALNLLREREDLSLEEISEPTALQEQLRPLLRARFQRLASAPSPQAALDELRRLGLLCAHRRGVLGSFWLNWEIERWLTLDTQIRPGQGWYPGRPILVTKNDQELGLFNGDTGVVRYEGGELAVYFSASPQPRPVAPARLPPHETVFALTVHKSQGSEYEEVILILPPRLSPVLTRELLYTAVTRASRRVRIFGREEILREAISQRVRRASGLNARLWHHG